MAVHGAGGWPTIKVSVMAIFASELFDFVKYDRISFDLCNFMTFFTGDFLVPAFKFEQCLVVVEPGGGDERPVVVATSAIGPAAGVKLAGMNVGVA